MKDNPPVLLILQVLPILVVVLSIVNPSWAIPLIAAMFVLFPFVLFKFFQQASRDFEREMYSRNSDKQEFKRWYEMPVFDVDVDEPESPLLAVQPHLHALNLSYPFDEEDLNRAYRRRARETHPDLGGSEREFIRVRQAYDALKQFLDGQRQADYG